jgi:undecaprenyl-diphosphatase
VDSHLSAILLGIIEGVTEFLPISSTGHLLIAEKWLGARSETFNLLIQFGSVLAVTVLYRRRLTDLCQGWRTPENRDYLGKLLAAFGLTCLLGLAAKALGWRLPETVTPVAWALILGGVFILIAEWRVRHLRQVTEITWTIALAVALAQIIAGIFPGTSRSAATILTAVLLGVARPAATEFAFILGIPTMFVASAAAFYKDMKLDHGGIPIESWTEIGLAFVVASGVAFITVKWLLRYIQKHSFSPFGWYRIVLGGGILLWFTR